MHTDNDKALDSNRIIIWILGVTAIAAVIFDLFRLLPLFSAYFIRDDYLVLDLGAFMRQQDPLAFLTATCIGWWRPIAYVLPALVYLLFGFTPVPYHILAYAIHLLTGITLIMLGGKFFNLKVGIIAFIIYFTSPIAFSNVGWMLGAMEDETAALFYLLAIHSQLRVNPKKKTGPYYLPALFLVLGSFCKITWLGLIPALLFMDWVNYPKSRFTQRITRFLPFLVFIPTLFLNFLFIGFSNLGGSFVPNFNEHFIARNMIPGSFYSFIPLDLFLRNYYQIAVVVPVLFVILAVLFSGKKSRIFAIVIAYIGTLGILGLAQISRNPVGWMMGWRHLTPLVGFAAMIMAVSIVGFINKLRMGYAGWSIVIILLISLFWSGLPMKNTVKEDILNEGVFYRKMTESYITLCQSFPKQTEIYIIAKKPLSVNLLADLAGSDRKLAMLLVNREGLESVHNYAARSKHYILEDIDEIKSLLDQIVQDSNARLISMNREGIWIDITGSAKDEFGRMLTQSH